MRSKTTISLTEARKKIFDIAERVQHPNVYYTLTENGRPKIVLMSAEEFESWIETLDVKKEFPRLGKDAAKAEKDYAKGNYITLEEVLAKEGYLLADKAKRHYAAPRRRAQKRAKQSRSRR